jgi:hypothetical protein
MYSFVIPVSADLTMDIAWLFNIVIVIRGYTYEIISSWMLGYIFMVAASFTRQFYIGSLFLYITLESRRASGMNSPC